MAQLLEPGFLFCFLECCLSCSCRNEGPGSCRCVPGLRPASAGLRPAAVVWASLAGGQTLFQKWPETAGGWSGGACQAPGLSRCLMAVPQERALSRQRDPPGWAAAVPATPGDVGVALRRLASGSPGSGVAKESSLLRCRSPGGGGAGSVSAPSWQGVGPCPPGPACRRPRTRPSVARARGRGPGGAWPRWGAAVVGPLPWTVGSGWGGVGRAGALGHWDGVCWGVGARRDGAFWGMPGCWGAAAVVGEGKCLLWSRVLLGWGEEGVWHGRWLPFLWLRPVGRRGEGRRERRCSVSLSWRARASLGSPDTRHLARRVWAMSCSRRWVHCGRKARMGRLSGLFSGYWAVCGMTCAVAAGRRGPSPESTWARVRVLL